MGKEARKSRAGSAASVILLEGLMSWNVLAGLVRSDRYDKAGVGGVGKVDVGVLQESSVCWTGKSGRLAG